VKEKRNQIIERGKKMKQLTILIAVLILAATEIYSADLTLNTDLNDYNQFASLLANDNDLAITSVSVTADEVVTENSTQNEESELEDVADVNNEESNDELFDSSAGAMGLGIF
jgi:hypothetical protein